MAMKTLTIELPEEIISILGSQESAPLAARKEVVLGLLRQAKISQGKAAELLGLSRWEMSDLIIEHQIPTGPQTAEEFEIELETIRRLTEAP